MDIYITDVLRVISESTAKLSGGPYIKQRYADLIKPKEKVEKSGAEIADSIISRLAGR